MKRIVKIFAVAGVAAPSFLTGIARAFDMFGVTDRVVLADDWRQDGQALASDWQAVGGDLRAAKDELLREHPDLRS